MARKLLVRMRETLRQRGSLVMLNPVPGSRANRVMVNQVMANPQRVAALAGEWQEAVLLAWRLGREW